MPRQDKTGPAGKGPRTGRGMGNCQPTNSPKTPVNRPANRPADGRGRSNGMGRQNRGK